jgi:short-subunit dehydrogenase
MSLDAAFADRYGPWAFVAGASEGIGAAFARQLAAAGVNVVLTARRRAVLDALADEIRAESSADVRVAPFDLTSSRLVDELAQAVGDLDVGLMIYNAGAETGSGRFVERPVDDALHLVDLNCRGPIVLTHWFGGRMVARGRGGMILMTSMAAGAGAAYNATYGATKAFDRTLAEALWVELGQHGVDVVAVVAGLTDTPAMRAVGLALDDSAPMMSSDEVAAEGLAALGRGPMWVAGDFNREAARALWPEDRAALALGMSAATAPLYGFPVPTAPGEVR